MKLRKQLVAGCLLILASGLMLLFIFAMSTLSGGAYPEGGAHWWSAVLGAMFRSPDPGTLTYICIFAMAFGLYLCVRPAGVRTNGRRITAWVAVLAVALGILAWSASRECVVVIAKRSRPDGATVITKTYANLLGITRETEEVEK